MDSLVALALYPIGTASLAQIVLLVLAMVSALWALVIYPWRHWPNTHRIEHRPAVLRTASWATLGAGLAGGALFAGALEDAIIDQVAMAGPLFGAGIGYFIATRSALRMLKDALAQDGAPAPMGNRK